MSVNEEAKRETSVIVRAMKNSTKAHIGGVYGVVPGGAQGELIGSGLFVRYGGGTYLLTAGHNLTERDAVLSDDTRKYDGIAIFNGNGNPPRRTEGKLAVWKQPFDLGLVQAEVPDGAIALDLGDASVVGSSAGYGRDVLFVHGLPGTRSHPFFGVHSKTLPHVGAYVVSQYDWFDPKVHLSIEYSPNDLFDEKGVVPEFEQPKGMSGCPLWTTGRVHRTRFEDWGASDARLVGIVHNWDDKAHCLIATRIESVREFVRVAAESIAV